MAPTAPEAVSFDLFGTLVDVAYPSNPAVAVADELERRGVPVPDDWNVAYAEPHVDVPDGTEIPLAAHVRGALESRGVDVPERDGDRSAIGRAVAAAFDPDVSTREGAIAAVRAADSVGPVGVLSNCSVRGLVERTLSRSELDPDAFDVVVSSVDCGWRKPDRHAFEAVATRLAVSPSDLAHVGDDPHTDGGAADVGATAVLIDDVPLRRFRSLLEAKRWPP